MFRARHFLYRNLLASYFFYTQIIRLTVLVMLTIVNIITKIFFGNYNGFDCRNKKVLFFVRP